MAAEGSVAVVDIGKTNAKVVLVDRRTLTETAGDRMANKVSQSGPYPHYDERGLWTFIVDSLATLGCKAVPDAVVVTAHGASGVLVGTDGTPSMPILDYEHDGPDSLAAEYDALRPDFSETGSPRLPGGLNVGAQLFWQQKTFPDAFAKTSRFVTYPQFWASRLCGVAATEPTSLGAHTDLWNPHERAFSSLVDRLGWRQMMAPVRRAGERLGRLDSDLAKMMRLPAETPVFCGIHDSNASLYPHLISREAPFSVVSTGTWVIVMSVGAAATALDPSRDTLINVNAFGDPVASARFMGGREFSLLVGDEPAAASDEDVARVLATPLMLTPSIDRGSGPFRGRRSEWLPAEPATPGERFAAVSFYLAMMTATCLNLTGATGETIVEGPFGSNRCFVGMVATATGRPVLVSPGSTGTSIGAALLCSGGTLARGPDTVIRPNPAWKDYAARWRAIVEPRS